MIEGTAEEERRLVPYDEKEEKGAGEYGKKGEMERGNQVFPN